MARFRVGNVRFGGGRKASIGFHGFGVGATFGGGRRSGSGNGSNSSGGGYVETRDWDSLTDHEKTTLPLSSFKSINIDNSTLSVEDKALLAYRRKQREYQIRGGIIAAFLVLVTIFSGASSIILACASAFSIVASICFSYAKIKTMRIRPGVEPTYKQLRAWSLVNEDKTLPDLNIAYSEVQKKYGDEASQAAAKLTGKRVNARRSLTFKDLVATNFYINIILLFSAVCAIGVASNDDSTNCVGRTSSYYSGLIWGIGDCYDLDEHLSNLKGTLIFIGISTLIAFTVSVILGCKPTYKQHLKPLANLLKKKTPIDKLKPKDIASNLKQQRNQIKQTKVIQAEAALARKEELRERFKKNTEQ